MLSMPILDFKGRIKFKQEDWQPYTFDMDSLVLQKVQDPQGAFPWTTYCSVLGIPGLTAFGGFEGHVRGKKVNMDSFG